MGYKVIRSDNYLKHFGVLGMHWGEWNEETRARYMGGSKRSGQVGEDGKPKKRGLTERQKKAIKIGATIAATILVSYAGVKLSTDPRFQSMIRKGLEKANKTPSIEDMIANNGPVVVRKSDGTVVKDLDFLEQNNYKNIKADVFLSEGEGRSYYDSQTEIVGTFSESTKQEIENISKNIKNINKNANGTGNCIVASTLASLPDKYQGKYTAKDVQFADARAVITKIYKGSDFRRPIIQSNDPKENFDSLIQDLVAFPNGARGSVLGKASSELNPASPGHILNWKKVNDELVFYDADTNVIRDSKTIYEHMFSKCDPKTVAYIRIDNRKVNKNALKHFLDEATEEGSALTTGVNTKGIVSTGVGVSLGGATVIKSTLKNKKIIDQYKKDHPNTKKTNLEILEMYKDKK